MPTVHELTVPTDAQGLRLDVWLESVIDDLTRSRISRLIKAGQVTIAPGELKAGRFLDGGEQVVLTVPDDEPMEAFPEDIPLTVLHEDEHLIAIDKPPGMVVHPAAGHLRGTLVNALLGRYGTHLPGGEGFRPGIVHRLDEDTSGVIVVARTIQALAFLQDAFRERVARKRYLALLAGVPRADLIRCDGAIGRHPKDIRKRAIRELGEGDAREANTTFLIRGRKDGYAIAEARPKTGRTHQIRVHAAAAGHAVLADVLYGRSAMFPPNAKPEQAGALHRQALHAWTLELPHPAGGTLTVEAPIPADLKPFIPAGLVPLPW